jgi:hypothetical protein
MAEVFKVVSVFLMCALVFGKIGMPAAMVLFKYNFGEVFIVSCIGGITGNILFTNLSAVALRWYHNYRVRRGKIHKKRIFTPFNRRIIRIKNRFGLTGIAFITPLLLSTPLGAFLAERFFKDKKKIIIYLSVSTVFWSLALYLLIRYFHNSIEGWLI